MDFGRRAHLSEWMDEPCSYADFRECLHDLQQVNRLTLAYRPTMQWLQSLLRSGERPVHIVDVGCGGGDMLRRIERWARSERIALQLTGIDLNPYAAQAAREFTTEASNIEWVTGDAFSYDPRSPIDLVISSLFTHHLGDDQITRFLRWMEDVTVKGWFVNDLHREAIPYFGFKALATVMRWHRFVRHDGPISIRRAFQHQDWKKYLAEADLFTQPVELTCYRPARLCVSRVKQ